MQKLNQKTEETILIVVAMIVLFSSIFNPSLSIGLAALSLIIFLLYNYLTGKK
ncbi:MAG: hypothetical protein WC446_00480 [Candidatus Paceibacterota bacterium]|jgi:hypothetical protein